MLLLGVTTLGFGTNRRIKMIRSFIISFALTLTFMYNINETNKSFDRCEELVQEIKQKGEYLEVLKTYYNW